MNKSKKNITLICLFSIVFLTISTISNYTVKAQLSAKNSQVNVTKKGVEWTKEFSSTIDNIGSIAYNNKDTYVAIVSGVAEKGLNFTRQGGQYNFFPNGSDVGLYTSKNGGKWIKNNIANFDGSKVEWLGNRFVVLLYDGTVKYTSADGLKWETPSAALADITNYDFDSKSSIPDKNLEILLGAYPNQFKCMTCFNNNYIAAGDNGIYQASANDMNWHKQDFDALASKSFTDMINTGNKIVAIGNKKCAVSKDGKTWESYDLGLPSGTDINSISYVSGKFFAVGTKGTIISSVDGTKWTSEYYPYSSSKPDISKITSHENQFVAIGRKGFILVHNSQFGWVMANSETNSDLKDIIWDGSKYVVLGENGMLLTSKDGKSWVKQTQEILSDINSIAFCKGIYTGVGDRGIVLTSNDCKSWSKSELDTYDVSEAKDNLGIRVHNLADILSPTENLVKVITDGERFLTFGNYGNLFIGTIKSDSINQTGDAYRKYKLDKYTISNKKSTLKISDIIFNGKQLLVKRTYNTQWSLLTSSDNKNYYDLGTYYPGIGNFEGLIYNGKYFITFFEGGDDFEGGEILVSRDGSKWKPGNSNFAAIHPSACKCLFNRNFDKIKYNGSEFLIKEGNVSYVSKDGLTWSKRASISIDNIKNVITMGKLKIKVTDDGKLWLTKTINKWSQLNSKNGIFVNNLSSNGKVCVVVGKKGYIGIIDSKGTLSKVKTIDNSDITKVILVKDQFMALTANGHLLVSSNGRTWNLKSLSKY